MNPGEKGAKLRPRPSLADYHPEAEVVAALEGLTDADIRYLVGFARCRILGADPDDLCSDAITKTLKLKRKWKRGVSMRNHLIACMRSIGSSRFKRAMRDIELSPEHPAPCSDTERAVDAVENVTRLRLEIQNDAAAYEVLTTLYDGLSPKQAQEVLHMRPKVYWAARRRIRRLAEKLFGRPKERQHA